MSRFPPKRNKYNNKRVKYDGYTFDSEREKEYYVVYKGDPEVESVQVHPRYELTPKFTNAEGVKRRAQHYVADFLVTFKDGRPDQVVDVKGMETPMFKFKRTLFEYRYGTVITVVK